MYIADVDADAEADNEVVAVCWTEDRGISTGAGDVSALGLKVDVERPRCGVEALALYAKGDEEVGLVDPEPRSNLVPLSLRPELLPSPLSDPVPSMLPPTIIGIPPLLLPLGLIVLPVSCEFALLPLGLYIPRVGLPAREPSLLIGLTGKSGNGSTLGLTELLLGGIEDLDLLW